MNKYCFNNISLDKYQIKAIKCKKRSYLVVAGAGSGKTFTICAKIKYLIENGLNEKKILCISFTNETVNSLKESLKKNNLNIEVKTFHKLALDILGKKYNITSSNYLEYVTNEYFESLVYQDNSSKLLSFIDNIDNLKNVIIRFINKFKCLNLNTLFLEKLLKDKKIPIDDKIILTFVYKVYNIYEEELTSENKIDFNDMINISIDKIDKLRYFRYSYIIVDEYQDTSYSKYLMIKKLYDKFNISIMAVGDDYQSIYSFNGCKLDLFTKFKKYFPKSKIIRLKNTYRNPSDIVNISKRFVMSNKNQINKKLLSNKHIEKCIVIVYINDERKGITTISQDLDNVLILGRNNKDIEEYISNGNLKCLTVHKSKGLESENVIILNVIDDILGFPNKLKEDNILNYLDKSNSLEEERRLFYVALTRTKNKVFIFTKKNQESIFVKELLKHYKYKIKILDLT